MKTISILKIILGTGLLITGHNAQCMKRFTDETAKTEAKVQAKKAKEKETSALCEAVVKHAEVGVERPLNQSIDQHLERRERELAFALASAQGDSEAEKVKTVCSAISSAERNFFQEGIKSTMLGCAVYKGDIPRVQFLIEGLKAAVDGNFVRDKIMVLPVLNPESYVVELLTPFMLAVLSEKFEVADFLLKKGASINAKPAGLTVFEILMHCTQAPRVAVRFLIDRGAHLPRNIAPFPAIQELIRDQRKKRESTLLLACASGNELLLKKMLDMGVDVRSMGMTTVAESPLICAAQGGHAHVIDILLNHCGISDAPGSNGDCARSYIMKNKDMPSLRVFMEYIKKLEPTLRPAQFHELLVHAVRHGGKESIEAVINASALAARAVLNNQDKIGQTVLMYAVQDGNKEAVETLLMHKPDIHSMDMYAKNALMYATSPEVTQLLKEASQAREQEIECFFKSCETAEPVLGPDLTVNYHDMQGRPLLVRALEERNKGAVRYLLAHEAYVRQLDHKQRTPLMCAVLTGDKEFVELLYSYGAFDTATNALDAYEDTPLSLAARRGMQSIVDFFIDNSFEHSKQARLKRAFTEALSCNQVDLVEHLISKGMSADEPIMEPPLLRPTRPLTIACTYGKKRSVDLLLEKGAFWNPDTFWAALARGHYHLAAFLLGKLSKLQTPPVPAVPNQLPTWAKNLDTKVTAEAKQKMHPECLWLMKLLAQPALHRYLENPEGCCDNFLEQYATFIKNFMVAESERGKQWELCYSEFQQIAMINEQTLLIWACIFGHKSIVEKLVTAGLPRKYINKQDTLGRTALMYALLYGNIDCALTLIYHERIDDTGLRTHSDHCGLYGINLRDREGRTALFYAALACKFDAPVKVDIKGEKTQLSLFDSSRSCGAQKIVDRLVALGGKMQSQDTIALALKIVAEDGSVGVLTELLKRYVINNRVVAREIIPSF